MRAAAGRGLLGVTIPRGWGGAGRDYVSYVAGDRGDRRPARRWPSRCRSQLARRRSASPTPGRAPQKEQWLRRLASGEAIGAFALSEPDAGTDAANQKTQGGAEAATATGSPAAKSGSPTPKRRPWRSCSRARGPDCAGRGSRRSSCRWTRPASRGRRAPIRSAFAGSGAWTSSSTSPSATIRCSARSIRASGLAMWALQGGRVAIAAQALGIGEAAIGRSARATRSSARRSASRSPTTRRSSGCWPTWPPSSRRRGC